MIFEDCKLNVEDGITLMVEIFLVTLFLVTFIIFVFFSFCLCLFEGSFYRFCRAVNLYKQYAAEINTYKYLQIWRLKISIIL